MRIENEVKLDFSDVLIRPKRSTLKSRSEVSLIREFTFKYSQKTISCLPIIASNMDSTGTQEMAKVLAGEQMLTASHKFYDEEQWLAFSKANPETTPYVFYSIGMVQSELDQLKKIHDKLPVAGICIDVANGYTESFVNFVRSVRKDFPDTTIMAGNVVTGEMTEELILSGADIVKVGIGPGSVCTTRIKTGIGYPQLSAVIECADAAHGLGGLILSDGGCTTPADVSKAFAAGADFVMLGGMLAGHDESGGDIIEHEGKKYKQFYGMSSSTAMNKHYNGVAEYRASEGKTVRMPYRGPVSETIKDILGGVRSTCTYVGARRLKELSKRTTFIRVPNVYNTSLNSYEVE